MRPKSTHTARIYVPCAHTPPFHFTAWSLISFRTRYLFSPVDQTNGTSNNTATTTTTTKLDKSCDRYQSTWLIDGVMRANVCLAVKTALKSANSNLAVGGKSASHPSARDSYTRPAKKVKSNLSEIKLFGSPRRHEATREFTLFFSRALFSRRVLTPHTHTPRWVLSIHLRPKLLAIASDTVRAPRRV